jgi:lysophospholipase L1-like esterase
MKKRYLVLLKLSLILNIILIIGIILVIYKYQLKIYDKIVSHGPCKIVMFGNSLTAQGNWNEDLNRLDIKNSGKSGFTTSQFVYILYSSVIQYKPEICFIEGGINDIGTGIPLSRTYKNYESIVDTLIKYKIEPVLQSTLYVNQANDSVVNSKVDSLNYFLLKLASKKNVMYLELNPYLSENKRLKKEFSKDGIHLKESAYKIWVREVKKILDLKGI